MIERISVITNPSILVCIETFNIFLIMSSPILNQNQNSHQTTSCYGDGHLYEYWALMMNFSECVVDAGDIEDFDDVGM